MIFEKLNFVYIYIGIFLFYKKIFFIFILKNRFKFYCLNYNKLRSIFKDWGIPEKRMNSLVFPIDVTKLKEHFFLA